ncbi:DUF1961 family protein [Planctomycetota bacterium]|nr:DUF1961 family protein [Planctomycetota bacterium]
MIRFIATILALSTTASVYAVDEKPLDFWAEETLLFNVVAENQHISVDKRLRPSPAFSLEHSDKKVGDLSISFSKRFAKDKPRFGFVADLWGSSWQLTPDMNLHFWVKITSGSAAETWSVELIDINGNIATTSVSELTAAKQWLELSIPLNQFKATSSFDWNAVRSCEFDVDCSSDTRILFDGVAFSNSNQTIGVTDKTVTQRMAEATKSRQARVNKAFSLTRKDKTYPAVYAFAKLYLNEDIDSANDLLVQELKKSTPANYWGLLETPLYCRIYYMFSNKVGKFPGRLKPETETLLLETLWERTVAKNDINWAKQSTWWLDGSENHDLNAKASSFVASRIFMNEPEYKDKLFPDYGFGGGYHYGHAGYYGENVNPDTRHHGGRANLSDGKRYNAEAHYNAWLGFMKEYFRERAERGFFLENRSIGYSKHTLNMVDLIYQYGGDAELTQEIDDFLKLYWAEWAQNAISGIHGGPKTRHHHRVGDVDSTMPLIVFLFGGPGNGEVWYYWNLISDFEMPSIVWNMALDRQRMGSYVYQSRGIGEEQGIWPRPLGTERTLLCDTDSRFLKYSYVTPDYVLGTQMDHPGAVHSHLSVCGRWHGLTTGQSRKARIVPVGIPEPNSKAAKKYGYDIEVMFRSVQHKNTLIIQQSRSWSAIDPAWYPRYHGKYERNVGIYIGNDWDNVIEKDGWVFLQKGNTYSAVRPILWDKEFEDSKKKQSNASYKIFDQPDDDPTVKLKDDCYTWNDQKTILLLEYNFSPVIIEAGRKADYATMDAFISSILDNPVSLYKTVVPGFNVLTYKGNTGDNKQIVFNTANTEIPTVGQQYINYSYPMTFDSPYIKSKYKSGKVSIEFNGEKLDLDFTKYPKRNKQANTTMNTELKNNSKAAIPNNDDRKAFEAADDRTWTQSFYDSCTDDWTKQWFLDGKIGSVTNTSEGMQMSSGPQFLNDAHHMVLWTKDEFKGDVKIEYKFTRLDFEKRCVNILYIQATGSDDGPYKTDITKWSKFREVPAMKMYFNHMNTYHISYAAFPNAGDDRDDYIRARRYVPNQTGLENTDLKPDYFRNGFFTPGVPHRITVIKQNDELFMRISTVEKTSYFHWKNDQAPPIEAGRIGLRLMFCRSSRFKDFKVSVSE